MQDPNSPFYGTQPAPMPASPHAGYPYQEPYRQQVLMAPMVDNSNGGTMVFVYGLLGFMLCQIFAPIAWVKGNEYIRTCAAMGVQPSGLGVAGRILGIVGTALFALSLVFVLFALVVNIAAH